MLGLPKINKLKSGSISLCSKISDPSFIGTARPNKFGFTRLPLPNNLGQTSFPASSISSLEGYVRSKLIIIIDFTF